MFDVPYVSTYYFNPKPSVNDTIQIPLYITDSEMSEYMNNDTSKRLDLIYEIDGVEKVIRDLPLGDYTLTIGKLSAGTHLLAVQVLDRKTGLTSHKLYNDLWVVDQSYTITAAQTYTMTTADLAKYKIHNDDSKDATDLITTRDGLTQMFKDLAAAGYKKVVLLSGTYRINGEDARESCISIPSYFTVDMNQSTFKLDTITASNCGCIVVMNDVVDAHLINGTLEGDRYERQALGLEINGQGEGINTVYIKGGKYCSISDLTIRNTTGHTVWTLYTTGPYKALKDYTNVTIVNGKETASTKYSTSSFMDITDIINWDANEDYLFIGYPGGYRGIRTESAIIYVSFYDQNKKFMETVTGYQFRKMAIPTGAKYIRVTVKGVNLPTDAYSSIYVYAKHLTDYLEVKNIKFENTRTCALAPSTCNNLLIEGVTYTNCANSITPVPVDFEDGWEECQDVYYRNNTVISPAEHTTATIVDNAGYNHVYENCTNHQICINGRVTGCVIRNMKDTRNTVRWDLGQKICNGFGRIYNNTSGPIYCINQSKRDDVVSIKIKNCTLSSENNVFSVLLAQPEKTIYENCTFTKFSGSKATFLHCTIQPTGSMGDQLYFYDCTFKALDGSGKLTLNLSIPLDGNFQKYDADRLFERCKFEGQVTLGVENFHTGVFRRCEFENVNLKLCLYPSDGKILFENCTMKSNAESFLQFGPYGYSLDYINITFKGCEITHTGANLIGFTAFPNANSQILFDGCTVKKTSGMLVKWVSNSYLAGKKEAVSVDVIFRGTTVNKSLGVDTTVESKYARLTFQ